MDHNLWLIIFLFLSFVIVLVVVSDDDDRVVFTSDIDKNCLFFIFCCYCNSAKDNVPNRSVKKRLFYQQ